MVGDDNERRRPRGDPTQGRYAIDDLKRSVDTINTYVIPSLQKMDEELKRTSDEIRAALTDLKDELRSTANDLKYARREEAAVLVEKEKALAVAQRDVNERMNRIEKQIEVLAQQYMAVRTSAGLPPNRISLSEMRWQELGMIAGGLGFGLYYLVNWIRGDGIP